MLTIRKAQMDAFATERVRSFERRLVSSLQTSLPAAVCLDQLEVFVQEGVRQAPGYGLETEADVARYVAAMWKLRVVSGLFGPPDWATWLLNKDVPASAKLAGLEDGVMYQSESRRIRNAG